MKLNVFYQRNWLRPGVPKSVIRLMWCNVMWLEKWSHVISLYHWMWWIRWILAENRKVRKKVEIGVQIAGKNLGITKTCCDVLSIEVFKQNFESMDEQYTWTVLIFPRSCMQLCRVLKDNVFLDWKIRRSRKIYLLRKHFWINFQRNNGQFLSKKVVSTRMNLIR